VVALAFGNIHAREAPLVRVHSRCVYGEVFGSLDCDCAAQLKEALGLLESAPGGVLVYLDQEGRGCGLAAKAKAYELWERERVDTVDAYERLGLPRDARLYDGAAAILKALGLMRIRLLTNNPAKVEALEREGIAVERVPLRTKPTPENIDYLRVKQKKLGHDLGVDE